MNVCSKRNVGGWRPKIASVWAIAALVLTEVIPHPSRNPLMTALRKPCKALSADRPPLPWVKSTALCLKMEPLSTGRRTLPTSFLESPSEAIGSELPVGWKPALEATLTLRFSP